MPSLFPGMDPYIEGPRWADFHVLFITAWRIALNTLLPAGYLASIDESINLIEVDPPARRVIKPDVAVIRGPQRGTSPGSIGSLATLEPVTLALPEYEEAREAQVNIIHEPDSRLVTVLEILSPRNKAPGAGSAEYLAKRLRVIRQPVNLVEIDLLLGGLRLPMGADLPAGDYFALVSRADRRPSSQVYSWALCDPLPTIPIPLLQDDGEVMADIAAIFANAFEMGAYSKRLIYHVAPTAPIPENHREWLAALAKSAKPV